MNTSWKTNCFINILTRVENLRGRDEGAVEVARPGKLRPGDAFVGSVVEAEVVSGEHRRQEPVDVRAQGQVVTGVGLSEQRC